MASKGRIRSKECSGKVRHKTQAEAVSVAIYLREKDSDFYLKVYKCRWCHFWHLGHKIRVSATKKQGGVSFPKYRGYLEGDNLFLI